MGLADDGGSRFAAYVEGLASVIGHKDREGPLRDYCTGLMMPCERKSVEPLAAVTAPARVAAQQPDEGHARPLSECQSFKFTLRHADERLNDLRTAEAASLPANTHAELRRDIARLRVVRDQIKEIEQQRLQRIEQAAPSEKGPIDDSLACTRYWHRRRDSGHARQ